MAACDLWIACGQSNMAGRGDSSLSIPVPAGLGYEWRSGGSIALVDPIGQSGSAANTGCMVPAFVASLTTYSERTSFVVPCAVGGTSLLEDAQGSNGGWWDGGDRYNTAVSRAGNAITDLEGSGWDIETVGILWHQGEKDAQNYPTPATLAADYEAALIDLLARFRTDLSLPTLTVYVWQLGTQVGYETEYADVRSAQTAACATDGLTMVYDRCANFGTYGWMKADGLHYTQAGLNDMGTVGGRVVAADLGFTVPDPGPDPDPDPEEPVLVYRSAADTLLTII